MLANRDRDGDEIVPMPCMPWHVIWSAMLATGLNADESGTECTGWGCSARGVIDIAETDLRISRDQKSETEFDHHLSVSP